MSQRECQVLLAWEYHTRASDPICTLKSNHEEELLLLKLMSLVQIKVLHRHYSLFDFLSISSLSQIFKEPEWLTSVKDTYYAKQKYL